MSPVPSAPALSRSRLTATTGPGVLRLRPWCCPWKVLERTLYLSVTGSLPRETRQLPRPHA